MPEVVAKGEQLLHLEQSLLNKEEQLLQRAKHIQHLRQNLKDLQLALDDWQEKRLIALAQNLPIPPPPNFPLDDSPQQDTNPDQSKTQDTQTPQNSLHEPHESHDIPFSQEVSEASPIVPPEETESDFSIPEPLDVPKEDFRIEDSNPLLFSESESASEIPQTEHKISQREESKSKVPAESIFDVDITAENLLPGEKLSLFESDSDPLFSEVSPLKTVSPGNEVFSSLSEANFSSIFPGEENQEPTSITQLFKSLSSPAEKPARGSLFDDEEDSEPEVELIEKIMERRTNSKLSVKDTEIKSFMNSAQEINPESIKGLEKILQPYRDLITQFTAEVELTRHPDPASSSTVSKYISLSARRIASQKLVPTKVATLCLIFIFDDVLCICTESQLEAELPIVETWLDTDFLIGKPGRYPFTISTPETVYNCTMDSEEKLNLVNRVWSSTLRKRLEKENKYVNDSKRMLSYHFKSGQHYDGEWKAAKFYGKGLLSLPSREVYEGNFTNSRRNGFGIATYPNSSRYEGYWKFDKRHGKGTLTYIPSDPLITRFIGNWNDDKMHGEGELFLKNGTILRTVWKMGRPTYPGVLFLEDRQIRYIGDLSENYVREGFGVCIFSNDDRYYGSWLRGDRSGNGFMLSSKGTEFYGDWLNNHIQGNGSISFFSDTSTILTGRFVGTIESGTLQVNGEIFLECPTPKRRVSEKICKWERFFSTRFATTENSDQVRNLNEIMMNSVNSNQESSVIQQNLINILNCKTHPLGRVVSEFAFILSAMYSRPDRDYIHLDNAIDDLQSFVHLLSISISGHLKCDISFEDRFYAIHNTLFPEVYQTMFALYNTKFEIENQTLEQKIKQALDLPLTHQMHICGIDSNYWEKIIDVVESDVRLKAKDLDPSVEKTPFQAAVKAIRSISFHKTIQKKFECITEAANCTTTLLKKIFTAIGADEFLPLFCFVIIQASGSRYFSECAHLEAFMDDESLYNENGYFLAQLKCASEFLMNCDMQKPFKEKSTEHSPETPTQTFVDPLLSGSDPLQTPEPVHTPRIISSSDPLSDPLYNPRRDPLLGSL